MEKHKALHKYDALKGVTPQRVKDLLPYKHQILQFWADVKDLRWPEYYGCSPWDTASSIAYIVAGGKVTNPATLASDEYRIAKSYDKSNTNI